MRHLVHACGNLGVSWMPEVKITESASSKALVVRRCTLSLILSKQTGVKSIGSKTLRVKWKHRRMRRLFIGIFLIKRDIFEAFNRLHGH